MSGFEEEATLLKSLCADLSGRLEGALNRLHEERQEVKGSKERLETEMQARRDLLEEELRNLREKEEKEISLLKEISEAEIRGEREQMDLEKAEFEERRRRWSSSRSGCKRGTCLAPKLSI